MKARLRNCIIGIRVILEIQVDEKGFYGKIRMPGFIQTIPTFVSLLTKMVMTNISSATGSSLQHRFKRYDPLPYIFNIVAKNYKTFIQGRADTRKIFIYPIYLVYIIYNGVFTYCVY